MSERSINFDDKKIKKSDFYKNKNKKVFNIDDIDVDKILVSKKEAYGKNNSLLYLIGYNDNDVIRPLCLRLSQMTGYINEFNNKNKNENTITITMFLRVKDKQHFKKYNKIWRKKIERLMSIDFESKPFYGDDDDKYIKTKKRTFEDSIITNFHYKKMPKEKVPCKCLSIIMLDSVLKAYEMYDPPTFLGEYKYEQEKIKTRNYIDENLKSDSDSNDETESDSDSNDETGFDTDTNDNEKILKNVLMQ